MRYLYPLAMFTALGIVLFTIYNSQVKADPKKTAHHFLTNIKAGNFKEAVEDFGGNACRCPAKGGWVSYLIYSSSQEPNLAFMTGHPFSYSMGEPKEIEASDEAKKGSVPWQSPEDVVIDVKLKFDQTKYSPLFLPVFMAYGKDMSEQEFNKFISDPDEEAWKGFSLRLRPSLVSGAIERPEASKGIKYKPSKAQQEKLKNSKDDENYVYAPLEEMIRETLGEEGVLYLHPRDPGKVVSASGEQYSIHEIESKLPRLASINLRLHIVRRDQLKEWTVYHFALTEPELIMQDGKTIELENYRPRFQDDKWNSSKRKKSKSKAKP